MANKPQYTAQQMIRAIQEAKGLISLAARFLRCDPKTVRSYVKNYATVAEALREEREKMGDVAELALYNKIQKGEPWAVCFYLKTQGKERGYVERQELQHRGDEKAPIPLLILDPRNKK